MVHVSEKNISRKINWSYKLAQETKHLQKRKYREYGFLYKTSRGQLPGSEANKVCSDGLKYRRRKYVAKKQQSKR
jgi:hypothetical protein